MRHRRGLHGLGKEEPDREHEIGTLIAHQVEQLLAILAARARLQLRDALVGDVEFLLRRSRPTAPSR